MGQAWDRDSGSEGKVARTRRKGRRKERRGGEGGGGMLTPQGSTVEEERRAAGVCAGQVGEKEGGAGS